MTTKEFFTYNRSEADAFAQARREDGTYVRRSERRVRFSVPVGKSNAAPAPRWSFTVKYRSQPTES